MRAKRMSEWLESPTDDQNLETLTDILLTAWNNRRRWFPSRQIVPTISLGTYNLETGHPVLGGSIILGSAAAYTTTSAAALTLSNPAGSGEIYEVYYAGAVNNTQASVVNLTGVYGGNTVLYPLGTTLTNSQIIMNVVVGKMAAAAGGTGSGISGPVDLVPGDSMTITLATYAAGNDTEHIILYRRRSA